MNTQVEITTNEIWVHTRCLSHQEKYSHGILWKEAILINKEYDENNVIYNIIVDDIKQQFKLTIEEESAIYSGLEESDLLPHGLPNLSVYPRSSKIQYEKLENESIELISSSFSSPMAIPSTTLLNNFLPFSFNCGINEPQFLTLLNQNYLKGNYLINLNNNYTINFIRNFLFPLTFNSLNKINEYNKLNNDFLLYYNKNFYTNLLYNKKKKEKKFNIIKQSNNSSLIFTNVILPFGLSGHGKTQTFDYLINSLKYREQITNYNKILPYLNSSLKIFRSFLNYSTSVSISSTSSWFLLTLEMNEAEQLLFGNVEVMMNNYLHLIHRNKKNTRNFDIFYMLLSTLISQKAKNSTQSTTSESTSNNSDSSTLSSTASTMLTPLLSSLLDRNIYHFNYLQYTCNQNLTGIHSTSFSAASNAKSSRINDTSELFKEIDRIRYEELHEAYEMFSFTIEEINEINNILIAIILLGEFTFKENDDKQKEEEYFEEISMRLCYPLEKIKKLLRTRQLYTPNLEQFELELTENQSKIMRDSLVKALYKSVIVYIKEKIMKRFDEINEEIMKDLPREASTLTRNKLIFVDPPSISSVSSSISSLNTNTLSSSVVTSLGELCSNYSNEIFYYNLLKELQSKENKFHFDCEEFMNEKIIDENRNLSQKNIINSERFQKNEENRINMIKNEIFKSLDDQILHPNPSSEKILNKIQQNFLQNQQNKNFYSNYNTDYSHTSNIFSIPSNSTSNSPNDLEGVIEIAHSFGTVSYQFNSFASSNTIILPLDIGTLFSNSSNNILKNGSEKISEIKNVNNEASLHISSNENDKDKNKNSTSFYSRIKNSFGSHVQGENSFISSYLHEFNQLTSLIFHENIFNFETKESDSSQLRSRSLDRKSKEKQNEIKELQFVHCLKPFVSINEDPGEEIVSILKNFYRFYYLPLEEEKKKKLEDVDPKVDTKTSSVSSLAKKYSTSSITSTQIKVNFVSLPSPVLSSIEDYIQYNKQFNIKINDIMKNGITSKTNLITAFQNYSIYEYLFSPLYLTSSLRSSYVLNMLYNTSGSLYSDVIVMNRRGGDVEGKNVVDEISSHQFSPNIFSSILYSSSYKDILANYYIILKCLATRELPSERRLLSMKNEDLFFYVKELIVVLFSGKVSLDKKKLMMMMMMNTITSSSTTSFNSTNSNGSSNSISNSSSTYNPSMLNDIIEDISNASKIVKEEDNKMTIKEKNIKTIVEESIKIFSNSLPIPPIITKEQEIQLILVRFSKNRLFYNKLLIFYFNYLKYNIINFLIDKIKRRLYMYVKKFQMNKLRKSANKIKKFYQDRKKKLFYKTWRRNEIEERNRAALIVQSFFHIYKAKKLMYKLLRKKVRLMEKFAPYIMAKDYRVARRSLMRNFHDNQNRFNDIKRKSSWLFWKGGNEEKKSEKNQKNKSENVSININPLLAMKKAKEHQNLINEKKFDQVNEKEIEKEKSLHLQPLEIRKKFIDNQEALIKRIINSLVNYQLEENFFLNNPNSFLFSSNFNNFSSLLYYLKKKLNSLSKNHFLHFLTDENSFYSYFSLPEVLLDGSVLIDSIVIEKEKASENEKKSKKKKELITKKLKFKEKILLLQKENLFFSTSEVISGSNINNVSSSSVNTNISSITSPNGVTVRSPSSSATSTAASLFEASTKSSSLNNYYIMKKDLKVNLRLNYQEYCDELSEYLYQNVSKNQLKIQTLNLHPFHLLFTNINKIVNKINLFIKLLKKKVFLASNSQNSNSSYKDEELLTIFELVKLYYISFVEEFCVNFNQKPSSKSFTSTTTAGGSVVGSLFGSSSSTSVVERDNLSYFVFLFQTLFNISFNPHKLIQIEKVKEKLKRKEKYYEFLEQKTTIATAINTPTENSSSTSIVPHKSALKNSNTSNTFVNSIPAPVSTPTSAVPPSTSNTSKSSKALSQLSSSDRLVIRLIMSGYWNDYDLLRLKQPQVVLMNKYLHQKRLKEINDKISLFNLNNLRFFLFSSIDLSFQYQPYAPGIEFSINALFSLLSGSMIGARSLFKISTGRKDRDNDNENGKEGENSTVFYQVYPMKLQGSFLDVLYDPVEVERVDLKSYSATILTCLVANILHLHPNHLFISKRDSSSINTNSRSNSPVSSPTSSSLPFFPPSSPKSSHFAEPKKKLSRFEKVLFDEKGRSYSSTSTTSPLSTSFALNRIIGFNNDPWLSSSYLDFSNTTRHFLSPYNLNFLFLLPYMDEEIDDSIVELFLSSSFICEEIIFSWLRDINDQNLRYENQLQEDDEEVDNEEDKKSEQKKSSASSSASISSATSAPNSSTNSSSSFNNKKFTPKDFKDLLLPITLPSQSILEIQRRLSLIRNLFLVRYNKENKEEIKRVKHHELLSLFYPTLAQQYYDIRNNSSFEVDDKEEELEERKVSTSSSSKLTGLISYASIYHQTIDNLEKIFTRERTGQGMSKYDNVELRTNNLLTIKKNKDDENDEDYDKNSDLFSYTSPLKERVNKENNRESIKSQTSSILKKHNVLNNELNSVVSFESSYPEKEKVKEDKEREEKERIKLNNIIRATSPSSALKRFNQIRNNNLASPLATQRRNIYLDNSSAVSYNNPNDLASIYSHQPPSSSPVLPLAPLPSSPSTSSPLPPAPPDNNNNNNSTSLGFRSPLMKRPQGEGNDLENSRDLQSPLAMRKSRGLVSPLSLRKETFQTEKNISPSPIPIPPINVSSNSSTSTASSKNSSIKKIFGKRRDGEEGIGLQSRPSNALDYDSIYSPSHPSTSSSTSSPISNHSSKSSPKKKHDKSSIPISAVASSVSPIINQINPMAGEQDNASAAIENSSSASTSSNTHGKKSVRIDLVPKEIHLNRLKEYKLNQIKNMRRKYFTKLNLHDLMTSITSSFTSSILEESMLFLHSIDFNMIYECFSQKLSYFSHDESIKVMLKHLRDEEKMKKLKGNQNEIDDNDKEEKENKLIYSILTQEEMKNFIFNLTKSFSYLPIIWIQNIHEKQLKYFFYVWFKLRNNFNSSSNSSLDNSSSSSVFFGRLKTREIILQFKTEQEALKFLNQSIVLYHLSLQLQIEIKVISPVYQGLMSVSYLGNRSWKLVDKKTICLNFNDFKVKRYHIKLNCGSGSKVNLNLLFHDINHEVKKKELSEENDDRKKEKMKEKLIEKNSSVSSYYLSILSRNITTTRVVFSSKVIVNVMKQIIDLISSIPISSSSSSSPYSTSSSSSTSITSTSSTLSTNSTFVHDINQVPLIKDDEILEILHHYCEAYFLHEDSIGRSLLSDFARIITKLPGLTEITEAVAIRGIFRIVSNHKNVDDLSLSSPLDTTSALANVSSSTFNISKCFFGLTGDDAIWHHQQSLSSSSTISLLSSSQISDILNQNYLSKNYNLGLTINDLESNLFVGFIHSLFSQNYLTRYYTLIYAMVISDPYLLTIPCKVFNKNQVLKKRIENEKNKDVKNKDEKDKDENIISHDEVNIEVDNKEYYLLDLINQINTSTTLSSSSSSNYSLHKFKYDLLVNFINYLTKFGSLLSTFPSQLLTSPQDDEELLILSALWLQFEVTENELVEKSFYLFKQRNKQSLIYTLILEELMIAKRLKQNKCELDNIIDEKMSDFNDDFNFIFNNDDDDNDVDIENDNEIENNKLVLSENHFEYPFSENNKFGEDEKESEYNEDNNIEEEKENENNEEKSNNNSYIQSILSPTQAYFPISPILSNEKFEEKNQFLDFDTEPLTPFNLEKSLPKKETEEEIDDKNNEEKKKLLKNYNKIKLDNNNNNNNKLKNIKSNDIILFSRIYKIFLLFIKSIERKVSLNEISLEVLQEFLYIDIWKKLNKEYEDDNILKQSKILRFIKTKFIDSSNNNFLNKLKSSTSHSAISTSQINSSTTLPLESSTSTYSPSSSAKSSPSPSPSSSPLVNYYNVEKENVSEKLFAFRAPLVISSNQYDEIIKKKDREDEYESEVDDEDFDQNFELNIF